MSRSRTPRSQTWSSSQPRTSPATPALARPTFPRRNPKQWKKCHANDRDSRGSGGARGGRCLELIALKLIAAPGRPCHWWRWGRRRRSSPAFLMPWQRLVFRASAQRRLGGAKSSILMAPIITNAHIFSSRRISAYRLQCASLLPPTHSTHTFTARPPARRPPPGSRLQRPSVKNSSRGTTSLRRATGWARIALRSLHASAPSQQNV
jgi:hypothetical protein